MNRGSKRVKRRAGCIRRTAPLSSPGHFNVSATLAVVIAVDDGLPGAHRCGARTADGRRSTPRGACHTRNMRAGIVIIGGGIIGSSIAFHPARAGRAGDVVVIERDPTCEDAATTRSNSGVRRRFSPPENIEMASFGLALGRDLADMHEALPFLKTETDLAFRPEGAGSVGGVPDRSGPPGWNFSSPPRTSKTSSGPRSPDASRRWSVSGSSGAGAGTSRAARSSIRRSPGAGRAASRTSCSRTVFADMAPCTRQPRAGAWRSSS